VVTSRALTSSPHHYTRSRTANPLAGHLRQRVSGADLDLPDLLVPLTGRYQHLHRQALQSLLAFGVTGTPFRLRIQRRLWACCLIYCLSIALTSFSSNRVT
jgi:hypothetical protein